MSKLKIFIIILVALILGSLFWFVLPGKVILPQDINIFGWQIRIYGFILGLAVLSGYELARRRLVGQKLSQEQLDNITISLIIGGFIGARLYHVFSSIEYYISRPQEIIMVWYGGLSIFGAVLGGSLALWVYQKFEKLELSFGKLLDYLIPSLVVGQILGRFGNLFNYEAYGVPTNLAWKMFVPPSFRLAPYNAFEFFHPLFLYESLAGLLLLLILLNFSKLTKKLPFLDFSGAKFWFWVLFYGVLRLFTENLRIDSPYKFGFKQNLLVALVMIIISVGVFAWQRYKKALHEPLPTQNS